jgi:hypothetical protein
MEGRAMMLLILICSLCGLATVAIWGACWLNADRDRRARQEFNDWLESGAGEINEKLSQQWK